MKIINIFILFGFISNLAMAQEESNSPEESEKKHSIALIISHTHVTAGLDPSGGKKWITVPSWGLDYNYEFSDKWAMGIHSDIIFESFAVKKLSGADEAKVLERSSPFASAVMAIYKPFEHFSFQIGMGGEFSKEENFFLIRTAVEYSYRFHEDWEILANITNDYKIDAYNSWALGFGIARKF